MAFSLLFFFFHFLHIIYLDCHAMFAFDFASCIGLNILVFFSSLFLAL